MIFRYSLLMILCMPLLFSGCAATKKKCLLLDIGKGGSLNITTPNTSWMGIELGTVTGTGPVRLESCPKFRWMGETADDG